MRPEPDQHWLREAIGYTAFAATLFTAEIGAIMVLGNAVVKLVGKKKRRRKTVLLGDAIKLAHTPSSCEEAETVRAAAGALADYAAKMLEDRIGNLEWSLKRISFMDHRDKEDVRQTITGLKREHAEFFKGDKGRGWCR